MKTGLLFDLPKDSPSVREARAALVKKLKAENGIWTHCARGAGAWMAIPVPLCHKLLEGYNLTEEEKTQPIALMAGYCRLLDDGNLIADGYQTELEAVQACLEIIERYPSLK